MVLVNSVDVAVELYVYIYVYKHSAGTILWTHRNCPQRLLWQCHEPVGYLVLEASKSSGFSGISEQLEAAHDFAAACRRRGSVVFAVDFSTRHEVVDEVCR